MPKPKSTGTKKPHTSLGVFRLLGNCRLHSLLSGYSGMPCIWVKQAKLFLFAGGKVVYSVLFCPPARLTVLKMSKVIYRS